MKLTTRCCHILVAVLLTSLTACIHNDIPFPRIVQYITAIAADGQEAPAEIDNETFQVTITLAETTDPAAVSFSQFAYTPGADCSVNLLDGTYDLSKPLKVTLSKYQDYEWVISARQTITRYVSIAGQIGETIIDAPGHRVIVRVPEKADLSSLNLTQLKLGPEGITTLTPDIAPGIHDFTHPLTVDVTYFNHTESWTIYVEKTKQLVATTAVDAWSKVIWAYGEGPDDTVNSFQYRKADSDTWIDVPAEWMIAHGPSFAARIIHLEPLTQYVVRAVAGQHIGDEITVTTQATMILPDGSFDQWWLKNNKIWCPWDENGLQYWDTGNTGAATLGQSNVTPSDYTPDGTGQAAKLETRFVGIGPIGKLAAGSIYTGKFVKVDGTNGILDFGQPCDLRPTRLRGYYQYTSAPINYASDDLKYLINRPDSCHIYVVLADWDSPFEIRTNPKNQHLLDFSAPEIIAYGGITTSQSSDRYISFDIPLQYRSTSRKPKYILVCAAASKYGDYFTGGTGATLYVDQFTLEYDY